MNMNNKYETVCRHVKTHTIRSDEDRAAVSILETFLRSDGKINTNFSTDDKWPNHDGTFEFVANPIVSRRPNQVFSVQIKGTTLIKDSDNTYKYSLQSLAFPAYIYTKTTYNPGILFVISKPKNRGEERVFWKYMSQNFLNSINFNNNSTTITFTEDEEIKNNDDSVMHFCKKLHEIVEQHSFISTLEERKYSFVEAERIIQNCNQEITHIIDTYKINNKTRDDISKKMLTRLYDLCSATLLLCSINNKDNSSNLRIAWEHALFDKEVKSVSTFLRSLKYIGSYIPEDGQSERLMLKYYNSLWEIRKILNERFNIKILHNLEKFPLNLNRLDKEYYQIISNAIETSTQPDCSFSNTRYYVQKSTPFFVNKERYYEITLQSSSKYATKFNRITAYTKRNIPTKFSIQISYYETAIKLWDIDNSIKIITDWRISIEPSILNKIGKIIKHPTRINSKHNDYSALMSYLSLTGLSILEFIDLNDEQFEKQLSSIFNHPNTTYDVVLKELHNKFSYDKKTFGKNTARFLLSNLREEIIDTALTEPENKTLCSDLLATTKCYPFERMPLIYNFVGSKSTQQPHYLEFISYDEIEKYVPYLKIKDLIQNTGEIYFDIEDIGTFEDIAKYNQNLSEYDIKEGHLIKHNKTLATIHLYEHTSLQILKTLIHKSQTDNRGQQTINNKYVVTLANEKIDEIKIQVLKNAFVNSHLLLIYGAAGTGKTTLINHLSNLMKDRRKLFLTKTHASLQNLKRRIDNPGVSSEFQSIDSFTKKVNISDYDIIFVDECSIIDNRKMYLLLNKIKENTLLVLAGDIHQIESIEFGNWFLYAKELISNSYANVELLSNWRTEQKSLKDLWNEVRTCSPLITETLVIDGPFSENIGKSIFDDYHQNQIILCLNYDGKFGLNNMNTYFQNANTQSEAIIWEEWKYKVGDPILFNDSKRFSLLHNNLKGTIVDILKSNQSITFTLDVDILLNEADCKREGIQYIDSFDESTRIQFTVLSYNQNVPEDKLEEMKMMSVVPFQLAYAISIHKAQGLEYDCVKIVIPESNSEKISHGVFYTAITRAKNKLKIYWSSETMTEVVENFSTNTNKLKSLEIIKKQLQKS